MATLNSYLQNVAKFTWLNQGVLFLCFFASVVSFFLWAYLQFSNQQTNKKQSIKLYTLFANASNIIFAAITLLAFVVYLLKIIYCSNITQNNVFGGFDESFGIQHSSSFVTNFLSFVLSLILLYYFAITNFVLQKSTNAEDKSDNVFSNALIFAICGSFFAIISTNDIFNLYVFIEVSSICLYSSAFLKNNNKSTSAGLDYLIFGSLASCLIIFAIIVIYYLTGQLNIDKIATQLKQIQNEGYKNQSKILLLQASFWIFTIACFIKLATVPFFKWAINFYTKTNLIFTSFAASVVNKIYLYILFCVVFKIYFSTGGKISNDFANYTALYLAIFIFTFSIFAYFESNILRLIAISSIINTCYIIIASIFCGVKSSPLIILTFGDLVFKLLIFLILQVILQSCNKNIDTENNLQLSLAISNSSAKIKTLFVLCFLVIASLPPFPTFFAKIDIMLALLKQDKYLIFILLTAANVLSIFYFFKIIIAVIFLNKTSNEVNLNKTNKFLFSIVMSLIVCYFAFSLLI